MYFISKRIRQLILTLIPEGFGLSWILENGLFSILEMIYFLYTNLIL